MDILEFSVPGNGVFPLLTSQYQEICGHGKESVFSNAMDKATWLLKLRNKGYNRNMQLQQWRQLSEVAALF